MVTVQSEMPNGYTRPAGRFGAGRLGSGLAVREVKAPALVVNVTEPEPLPPINASVLRRPPIA